MGFCAAKRFVQGPLYAAGFLSLINYGQSFPSAQRGGGDTELINAKINGAKAKSNRQKTREDNGSVDVTEPTSFLV
jgi:hypothetical protein